MRDLRSALLVLAVAAAGCLGGGPDTTGHEGAEEAADAADRAPEEQASSSTSATATSSATTTSSRPWWDSDECRSLPSTAVWRDLSLFEALHADHELRPAAAGIASDAVGPDNATGAELHRITWTLADAEGRDVASHTLGAPPAGENGTVLRVTLDAAEDDRVWGLGHAFLRNVTSLDEAGRDAVLDSLEREERGDGRIRYDAEGLDLPLRLGAFIDGLRSHENGTLRAYDRTVLEEVGDWSLRWELPWVEVALHDDRGMIDVEVTVRGDAEATVPGDASGLVERIDAAFEAAGIEARSLAEMGDAVGIRSVVC